MIHSQMPAHAVFPPGALSAFFAFVLMLSLVDGVDVLVENNLSVKSLVTDFTREDVIDGISG